MKQGYGYTIIFMFAATTILTVVLALANSYFLPTIKANEILAEKKSILDALGEDIPSSTAEIDVFFDDYIKKETTENGIYYKKLSSDGKILAYAIPFTGAGLWGTISGYAGLSGNLQKLLGINFTAQSETPGLGGRIDEKWYRDQFRGVEVFSEGSFIFEPQKSGVDGITGATITTNAVNRLIKKLVEEEIPRLEAIK